MTRSSQEASASQQAPAAPEARAESGAESEGAAAERSSAGAGPVAPASSVAPGAAAAPGETAQPDATAEPGSAPAPVKPEAAAAPEGQGSEPRAAAPEADTDPDPGASAAAQSRLPALVRTMTATAIGKPQEEAGPVGRPGKAMLAGAAVAGALLVSVPFLVLAGNDDKGPEQPSTAAAGTVLDGSGPEAPGEFAVTAPETSSPAEDKDAGKAAKADQPVRQVAPPAAPPTGSGESEAEKKGASPDDPPKKANPPKAEPKAQPKAEPKAQPKAKNQPAKAQPAVTFRGPFSFRSHLSGRCVDVPGHNFNDGQRLFMWDCNGADAQKWRIGSDGTIRARDKCLDVAGAVFRNGTPIQLAWCNGSAAQKFDLNPAHDLVNTVVGMCVDIPNHSKSRGPSTYLILWECTGNPNQKWSS
ncbi:ricin-type beta-trefoil lectin domain protein [Streptomyces sp. NPDC101178]|uniref:ricin-type beta-trefoil lectin domain protein n=1 Tax=Streptomyces sp. NPDC101178 TaxID=3366124 RepID=UPI0037FAD203